jgi:hypothetical protein
MFYPLNGGGYALIRAGLVGTQAAAGETPRAAPVRVRPQIPAGTALTATQTGSWTRSGGW